MGKLTVLQPFEKLVEGEATRAKALEQPVEFDLPIIINTPDTLASSKRGLSRMEQGVSEVIEGMFEFRITRVAS